MIFCKALPRNRGGGGSPLILRYVGLFLDIQDIFPCADYAYTAAKSVINTFLYTNNPPEP